MAKVDRRKRLYYPYCGWKLGFCLSKRDCTHGEEVTYQAAHYFEGYKYWRARHPVTKQPPQSLLGGR